MVMAAGSLCQQHATVELSHEKVEEAGALHERLVAYVHSLAPSQESHSGVWVEHSYARARTAAPPGATHLRTLLDTSATTSAEDAPRAHVDVTSVTSSHAPPTDTGPASPAHSDTDEEDDQWEARVRALAPPHAPAHAALAERALDTLRALRLARLARGHEPVRAAARRLRHALGAALARAPAAWLHAALSAHAPPHARRLYEETVAELRRVAPRLAERALGAPGPAARRSALERVGPALGAESSPWLLWVSGGNARQDRRWRRRLGPLIHTRVVTAAPPSAAAPDLWCSTVASNMRAALTEALGEAGDRPVILGGSGAGASLCAALAPTVASSSLVRGVLLLAPALRTAEGARDAPDDPLCEVCVPLLLVCGVRAAQCWRGAVRRAAATSDTRHVLEVCGADDALRVPAHTRRALRLTQHALDATVADECARWALHAAEGEATRSNTTQRRRHTHTVTDHYETEEYAHLPTATHVRHEAAGEAGPVACEGRVVSRGSGGTPLALLPPRRAPAPGAAAPAPALAPADIMRLPIVFADDEPVEPDATPGAVTVTSGGAARRAAGSAYTRVIVASRGAGAGAGRGARPLLLRRTVRIVPRHAP